jgi:hypothetical protein
MGFIAPVLGIVGTVMSINESSKARKQQKQQFEAEQASQRTQQKIADLRAGRERKKAIAQEQIARAQQISGAFGAGAQSSSALAGALASSSSQLASNLGFSSVIQGLSEQVSIFNIDAARHQSKASTSLAKANLYKQGASIFTGPLFS